MFRNSEINKIDITTQWKYEFWIFSIYRFQISISLGSIKVTTILSSLRYVCDVMASLSLFC